MKICGGVLFACGKIKKKIHIQGFSQRYRSANTKWKIHFGLVYYRVFLFVANFVEIKIKILQFYIFIMHHCAPRTKMVLLYLCLSFLSTCCNLFNDFILLCRYTSVCFQAQQKYCKT